MVSRTTRERSIYDFEMVFKYYTATTRYTYKYSKIVRGGHKGID